jgi:hypothetical protein
MLRRLLVTLVVAGTFTTASAVRIVPSLGTASNEYGLSGTWTTSTDASGKDVSHLDLAARRGWIFMLGVEPELELGYGRVRYDATDRTEKTLRIVGNALWNINLFNRTTVFGMGGYGWVKDWTQIGEAAVSGTHRIYHYGFGLKYYFVPNAGIRIDYRWENATGLDEGVDSELYKSRKLMIGVSIYQ